MPSERPLPQVLMFSRRTCGLCDKARAVVLAERNRTPFDFDEVWIDGVEEFETFVDPVRFRYLVGGKA